MRRTGRTARTGRTLAAVAGVTVAAVTLSGCGFTGLYSAPLPGGANLGSHPFTITAKFDDVLDLVPQSAVKVNDVAVGKVTAISLSGWHAKVTMQVNDSVHLPLNARAEVAQTSLLGEKYVSLMQPMGAASKQPLKDGSTIPLKRTHSAPEVEQVLGALSLLLNQGGVQQIQVIARELNKALGGNESSIHALIGDLNTFVGTLNSQKTTITTALDRIDTLSRTLKRQKGVLITALDTYPQALKVLSDERGNLVKLLTSLSHLGTVATGVINATQTDFVSTLKSLTPVLDQLKAAGSALPESLRILGTFPFPLDKTRQFVKGDYANLAAIVNLNLSDELCSLLGVNETLSKACLKATAPVKSATGQTSQQASVGNDSTNTADMSPLIIGSGS